MIKLSDFLNVLKIHGSVIDQFNALLYIFYITTVLFDFDQRYIWSFSNDLYDQTKVDTENI